jgi:putative restriction endonuclease
MARVNQFERAYRAWPILTRVALNKGRIKYGELAEELKLSHHRPVKFVLEEIQNDCLKEKLLPLTILVENQKGIIGKGFTAWDVDDLDTGLQKVYAFDWNEVPNPFEFASDGTSLNEISSALAARTATSNEIYAKVRVRGMG